MSERKKDSKLVTCRICKQKVRCTQGLDEMENHWTFRHPEALANLRRHMGHDEDEDT